MTEQSVSERVCAVVANFLMVSPQSIVLNASLEEMSSWDSAQHLNLILALEEEFGPVFEPEQFEQLTSVSRIIRAIESAER